MKPIRFIQDFLQSDLFPDRSTVGREVTAELLTSTKVSECLTEIRHRPNGAMMQRRLPLCPERKGVGRLTGVAPRSPAIEDRV